MLFSSNKAVNLTYNNKGYQIHIVSRSNTIKFYKKIEKISIYWFHIILLFIWFQSKMPVPSEEVIAMGQRFAEKNALNEYIIRKLEREKTELVQELGEKNVLLQKFEEKKALFKEGDALNLKLITKLEKKNQEQAAKLEKAEAKVQEQAFELKKAETKVQEQAAKIQQLRKLLPGVAWKDS